MTIRIGHASLSENGSINGAKGDSTKKEVCIRNWYNKPWDYMAIHPDANVREKHAVAVEAACNNDNIGYGQGDRNTAYKEAKAVKYDIAKITNKCNCDCSSLQNLAAVASGAKNVTYGANGWTTSTMKSALKAAGYKIIQDSTILTNSAYCVRGAIYVKAGSHTICGLDNGSKYKTVLEKAGLETTSKNEIVSTVPQKSETPTAAIKIDSARSRDDSLAGKYTVTASYLHVRSGAGTNKKSLVVIPKGTIVRNYGFYTKTSSGTKWLYVEFSQNGAKFTGFCSEKYLTKK